MFSKNGQLSIEILIILIFLITFIYVYNNLSEQTVYTLEINRIKEQEQTIGLSLNEFLEYQKGILYDTEIVNYNSTYRLQNIAIPSKMVVCFVDINLSTQKMIVQSNYSNVYTTINLTITNREFILPNIIGCGEKITCVKDVSGKIKCD